MLFIFLNRVTLPWTRREKVKSNFNFLFLFLFLIIKMAFHFSFSLFYDRWTIEYRAIGIFKLSVHGLGIPKTRREIVLSLIYEMRARPSLLMGCWSFPTANSNKSLQLETHKLAMYNFFSFSFLFVSPMIYHLTSSFFLFFFNIYFI